VRTALLVLLSSLIGASTLVSCTQDFGVFEPLGDGGAADGGGDAPREGAADASGDAGPCTVAKACTDQATTCGNQCRSTRTQCESTCPGGGAGQSCRSACRNAETTCRNNCVAACVACGADAGCAGQGAACQSALP
jgi:hypothetical protein